MRPPNIKSGMSSDSDRKRAHAYCMGMLEAEINWRLEEIITIAKEPEVFPWAIIAMAESCQRAIASLSSLKEEGE